MKFKAIVFFGLVSLISACATLPTDYAKEPSTALSATAETKLGRIMLDASREHPGTSGFALVKDGRNAFTSRIALSDLAERTIDVQYYIWDSDRTGRILAERLVSAADRGVRVRILVDDLSLQASDAVVATLDAHPNVEIRLFNPFANRGSRTLNFASDFDRLNHRMHNKMIIFDNAFAIVGGRNIADIYFQVGDYANYRDLDIAAVGPVVSAASEAFDYFWNGDWSVPITAFSDREYNQDDLDGWSLQARQKIDEEGYPYPLDPEVIALQEGLPQIMEQLVWAKGWVVWDDPASIEQGRTDGRIKTNLIEKVDTLEDELLIESAYFVLPDAQVERVGELVDRGVRVRVLTNSLESNDVIAAHAGHAAHRKDLIREGAELYELKADSETVNKRIFPMRSRAALHTKAMAFDGESIFVGSFNLDPRSAMINTEAGVYVESPELAEDLIEFMDDGVALESSYHVTLDDSGDLVWTTEEDGQIVQTREEPGSSFQRSFMVILINLLPIEHLL